MFVLGNKSLEITTLEIKHFENIESLGYGLDHYNVIYLLTFDPSSMRAKYTMPSYSMS